MRRERHPRSVSYAELALGRFREWPLTTCRANCPPGRALSLRGRQIVHLHQGNMAEVLLTEEVINRLTDALTSSGRVSIPPDTGWVQVHLDTEGDLFLLESLVSLAIQANDPSKGPPRRAVTACPHVRPTVRERRRPVDPGRPAGTFSSRPAGRMALAPPWAPAIRPRVGGGA
ncbi:luciferase domain-containing protein [Actinomadura roseirufa]|uniref:luciferase domain-containing protein n=1 Tax=Actinomadura roseirufa TaxID=2094049 RepID=UPI0010418D8F|nr:luciferase family protein [Actinomadura roseirufa]